MYNANINAFNQLQNKEDGVINYETIEDFQKNSNYFKDQSIRLNQALKNSFFDTINKDNNNPEFDYKILQVKVRWCKRDSWYSSWNFWLRRITT
ncbi:hypothetical protein NW067_06925 [Mycoplasmopsis cynos]|nr:hypothetical protein [Mycoplasmopsis cynos]UWV82639.1 hypothetical protein NW067_06925 [Mycoplasmopsis cynos]